MRTAAVLVLLLAAVMPRVVVAQDAPVSAADDAEARSLYDAGAQAFAAGRNDRALEHFRRAYELSHRAGLLYNVGQAADRLRRDAEALDAFERYLASSDVDETLRPQVEARIEVLRAAVAASRTAPPPEPIDGALEPEPAPSTAPAPAAAGPDGAAIALLVAGGVALVAGGVMLGIAASENGAVQSPPDDAMWSDYAGRLDLANALFGAGGAVLGVGAVLGTIGIVLATSPHASDETTVTVGPGSLTLRGTF